MVVLLCGASSLTRYAFDWHWNILNSHQAFLVRVASRRIHKNEYVVVQGSSGYNAETVAKLFRSRLWNVKKGENRRLLCETAPAHVAGTYRSVPDACEDQVGLFKLSKILVHTYKGFWGTYGSWIVEDQKC